MVKANVCKVVKLYIFGARSYLPMPMPKFEIKIGKVDFSNWEISFVSL